MSNISLVNNLRANEDLASIDLFNGAGALVARYNYPNITAPRGAAVIVVTGAVPNPHTVVRATLHYPTAPTTVQEQVYGIV